MKFTKQRFDDFCERKVGFRTICRYSLKVESLGADVVDSLESSLRALIGASGPCVLDVVLPRPTHGELVYRRVAVYNLQLADMA